MSDSQHNYFDLNESINSMDKFLCKLNFILLPKLRNRRLMFLNYLKHKNLIQMIKNKPSLQREKHQAQTKLINK